MSQDPIRHTLSNKRAAVQPAALAKAGLDVPQPAVPMPGFTGATPLPVGRAVRADMRTDMEKKTLKQLGWRDGDPVPENLAEKLAAAAKAVSKEAAEIPEIDPETVPVLKMPPLIDITSLPPDRQKELREAVAQATSMPKLSSSVFPDVIGKSDEVFIEDDVTVDRSKSVAEREKEPAQASPFAPDEAQKYCPHCDWDLSMKDVPEPTEEEKTWYLEAMLGQVPYQKQYFLFGGRMQIIFRDLRPLEVLAVGAKIGEELRASPGAGLLQFQDISTRYRMALQLVRFNTGKHDHALKQSLAAWKDDAVDMSDSDLLTSIHDLVFSEVITSESTMRAVQGEFNSFQRLVAKLEVHAADENFYKASH